jgi:hypothetical protein
VSRRLRPAKGRREADVVPPTAERRRHGLVERAATTVKDSNGAIALPYRAVGAIEIMLRSHTINRDMFTAGDRFHREFVRAGVLDPLTAADPTRLPVLVSGARFEAIQGSE